MDTGNPFDHIRPGGQSIPARVIFIPSNEILKIMAATTDLEWQAILALARFGGLRCPSEVLALKWEHVNFEGGCLHVPSSKTAKQGKPFRVMPIFHELRPYLEALRHQASGGEYLITRYCVPNTNLRTQFDRLAKRAGVKVWPKPFQNMRASRATEVERVYGPAEVEWLGHTEKVALAHYLTVIEGDFARTAEESTNAAQKRGGRQSRTSETQNRVLRVENAVSVDSGGQGQEAKWTVQDSNL